MSFFRLWQDVVAPGLMVHSAKASLSDSGEETCALDSLGGTSMSAPAVAGAAALVRQFFEQGFLATYLSGAGLCGGSDEDARVVAAAGGVYAEAGLCEAFAPSGYLVKAVLINSAMWLGDMQMVSYGERSERGCGSERGIVLASVVAAAASFCFLFEGLVGSCDSGKGDCNHSICFIR